MWRATLCDNGELSGGRVVAKAGPHVLAAGQRQRRGEARQGDERSPRLCWRHTDAANGAQTASVVRLTMALVLLGGGAESPRAVVEREKRGPRARPTNCTLAPKSRSHASPGRSGDWGRAGGQRGLCGLQYCQFVVLTIVVGVVVVVVVVVVIVAVVQTTATTTGSRGGAPGC